MRGGLDSPWVAAAFLCSLGSLATFCMNLPWYRAPRWVVPGERLCAVSVLVPARNEEASIVAAVESILAQTEVELELLVMDDNSGDRTAELVEELALGDRRLKLHSAPPLPSGWNGKQHACAALGKLAQYDVLCYLDADVRLEPGALGRMVAELDAHRLDMLSGFPCEQTGTWLEKLLIPLIHFVLLCYLPMPFSRWFQRVPALAVGCGQVILVRKGAYEASGGHGAIRESMHDGLLLPRLLRRRGFATDVRDLTGLARCRMYRNAAEVWSGLAKNATEGMAAPLRIVPFTAMLFFGQLLPVLLLFLAAWEGAPLLWPSLAVGCGYMVRALAAWRFRQSVFGALLHPVGIAILLVLQWWSLARKLAGRRAVWKQRAYDVG